MDEFENIRTEERRSRRNALIIIWITTIVVLICASLVCTTIIQAILPQGWFRSIIVFATSWCVGTFGTRWTINFLKRKEL